jgi:tetratricopeptide (TPR) repeat protein
MATRVEGGFLGGTAMPEKFSLDPRSACDPDTTADGPLPAPDGAAGAHIAAGAASHAARYLLGEEIARGGMGVVHHATDTVLGREVAVKVLQQKYAPDSDMARRFTNEARITGQLQHPNIPAVHDLGVLPDGRPFLAMKLIKGETLKDLLQRRADPAEGQGRFVAAFEQVCQAVAYAHAHDVIHRDLSPANVMVGRFGEVQVMDWGLAKVLGLRPEEQTDPEETTAPTAVLNLQQSDDPFTRAGSVLGTPAFMPPEQAAGAVAAIGRHSDVFGLGAVLAVVLTGRPPFLADTSELARVKAAQGDVGECFARLDACGAEPELVVLCKRCLAPRPEERPADAGAVAKAVAALRAAADERAQRAELERVKAEGEAREATARAAEQRQRRRLLLAASGIIALVLLAGLSVSLGQMLRALQAEATANTHAEQARLNAEEAERNAQQARLNAEEAERNAQQARDERDAKDRALKAEQQARQDETKARQQAFAALRSMTTDVVERKFAQGAVLTADDRAFLRGIIAQFDAFAEIKGDDADSRAVRAEGRFRVGTMRYRLGELHEAEQDFDQALRIRKQLAADVPSRPEFRQDLANSHYNRGFLLRATGRLEEAEKDLDQALRIRKQLAADFPSHPEFRQDLANSHKSRGILLRATGQLKGAEQDFDQAMSILKQLTADFPSRTEFRQDLAMSHHNRGTLLIITGRLKEGKQDLDQAVSLFKQLTADFPSRPELRHQLAASHNSRGVLLKETGRLKEAEQDYDQALSIYKQLTADFPNQPDHRNDLAGTCGNLASLHQQQGSWTAAKRLLLEGRPHHLAALKANPRHPTYRQFYRNYLSVLTRVHAGLLEQEEAVRTAETCRDLGWNAPGDAYEAACSLSKCAPIVARHDKLDDKRRKEAAQLYGDAAMKLLRDAVSKGCRNVAHMRKDPDLDPLRQRADFQKLIAELEGKAK